MIVSHGPITLAGPAWVASAHFLSMHASERLASPFLFELEVVSDDAKLAPDQVLGEPVTVSVQVGKNPRHYCGVVSSLQSRGVQGERFVYRLVLRPWLWLLSRTTNCRIFQEKSVPDIIKQVFRERGFSDFEERLMGTYAPRPYVVQYRETDLHFVRRLLEDEGIYFYFTHAPGIHTLVLCDSISAHDPTPFYESLPHLPPDAQRGAQLEYLDTWETVHDVESGAFALTDYDFEAPGAQLGVVKAVPEKHYHGDYEVFDFPGNYVQRQQGETFAMTRLEEAKATAQRSLAEGNARGLLVGGLFTLSDHPIAGANRDYLVVSQEITLTGHQLESGASDAGLTSRCSVLVIPSDRQYRPPRTTQKPVVQGAQTATVVGKKGEEIWTDKYGRIKLRFHWDRASPGDETSSCWVRVAQIWAGSNFGGIHIPRIGQEVIVEFLEGDPDLPIVTGRVYNFDNMPPYELPMNQTQSGIKSRSTLGGQLNNFNEIRFEDKIGEEELFIHAEKNETTQVKNNRSASVGASDSISVGASRSVSVSDNLSVSVGTGGAAASTLSVTGTHAVDVSDTIDITAKTHIKLNVGNSTITLLPDSITLEVKGGAKAVLDAHVLAQSQQDSRLVLDANAFLHSSGSSDLLLDANACATSSGKSKLLLDSNATLESTTGTANVKAKVKVALVGGETGKVDLDAAGATMSGVKAKVDGASMTEIVGPVVKIN